jgi:hypothetical protein
VPLLHSSDPLRKNDVLASNLLFAALAIFLGEQLLWAYLAHWYLETSPLPNPFRKTWFVTPLVLALLAGAFFYAIRRGMFRAKMVVAYNPAPDPFLGHWQSESNTSFVLDASGNAASLVLTTNNTNSLDVTATTITFRLGTTSQANTLSYTRDGENLLYTDYPASTTRYYIRSLTANSCTIESVDPGPDGNMCIVRVSYHR